MATLVKQRRCLKAGIHLTRKEIYEFQVYLASPKFQGEQDYIRTWEVVDRLRRLDMILDIATERAGR